MSHLSTAEAAGQVIVAGFGAGEPSPGLCELARRGALGGFILFRRNLGAPREIAEQNTSLHALAARDRPLWIAGDQEGGGVAGLKCPVLRLPPMRALVQLNDPDLTQLAARTLGQ